jgi:hypothetical protein
MPRYLTSKERLLTAIKHGEPDLVPVSPRIYIWLKDNYGCACWLHQLRIAEDFDYDPFIYVSSPYPNYIGEFRADYEDLDDVQIELDVERSHLFTRIRRIIHTPAGTLTDQVIQHKPNVGYGSDPNPHWEERLVKEPKDLESLAFLLPKPEPGAYRDIVAVQGAVGQRGLVNLYINSALDHQAGWAVELVDLMVACFDNSQFVHDLLRLFQSHSLAETRAALEAGVEVVFVPWYFASMSAGWSPHFYEAFFLPLIKEHVSLAHDMGGLYHYYDDGAVSRILPWLADAGVDILSTVPPPPIGDVDLATVKAQYGDKLCFNGNVDLLHVIKDGTPELIHRTVHQLILDAAPGGGFILGTSDSIRDAPRTNVQAFFEAARKYGEYAHLGKDS